MSVNVGDLLFRATPYGVCRYRVSKLTDKGYWVETDGICYERRWCGKHSKYPFASATVEEATESYIQRSIAYERHCRRRLERARERLFKLLSEHPGHLGLRYRYQVIGDVQP